MAKEQIKAPAVPAQADFTFENANKQAAIRFNASQVVKIRITAANKVAVELIDEIAGTTKTGEATVS